MFLNTMDFVQFSDKKIAACLLFLVLELFIDGATSMSSAEIEKHLELGRDYLQRGQLQDALSHYHDAVEGDPSNYLTYFKRGTVYLALGKANFAIKDFTRVLELKPDFTAARLNRGSTSLKLGDYDAAELDLYDVLTRDPYNEDVNYMYHRINPAREQKDTVNNVIAHGDYKTAAILLTQLLEISPWDTKLRDLRAQCYIDDNDILSAISDLRTVNRLTSDNLVGYYRVSKLLYDMGHVTDALKEIRECLKLDPEHPECFAFYKKIKKVDKFLNDAQTYHDEKQYAECITSAEKALKNEPDVLMVVFNAKQLLCLCLNKDEQYAAAITKCREALEIYKDPNVLCERAEAYLETEMYDDAIRDYQAALEVDETLNRAREGLDKAKKLQKQSERRDYYKILGVKKSATKQEIVKAYRKAAQKWHPDNFHDDEKKIAEKKFIDVAAAKEVLTDPEKRQQFDNGEDPLDPEGNQQGFRQGNPFHQFHQGGSPFQFKFHFN